VHQHGIGGLASPAPRSILVIVVVRGTAMHGHHDVVFGTTRAIAAVTQRPLGLSRNIVVWVVIAS
jgi:hypothetical protein